MTHLIQEKLNTGVFYQINGDIENAQLAFEEILSIDDNNATAHNNLGFLLCQSNRWEKGMEHLEKAVILNPESDTAHLNKGHAHLAKGEVDQAYLHYTKALAINNENPLAWESYAKFFMVLGQHQDAAQAWAQAIQLKPNDFEYQLELAGCLSTLGLFNDARPILEDILKDDTHNVRALTQLGIVYFLRKDFGVAAELFTRTLGLVPEDATARYHLGLTYLVIGEQAKAEQEFRRLIQLHPENVKARTDLAVLLLSRGEKEAAQQELNTCVAGDPGFAKAKYYQGVVLHQMGQTTEAESILKSLVTNPSAEYGPQAQAYLDKYIHA